MAAPNRQVKIPKGSDVESFGKGILYTGGGFLLVSGTIWGIRKLSKLSKEQNRQDGVFDDVFDHGTPAHYANRLKRALNNGWFGWSEDEDEIKSVFLEIPTQSFYGQVSNAYSNLTKGDSLNSELNRLLDDSELNELMQILNSKP